MKWKQQSKRSMKYVLLISTFIVCLFMKSLVSEAAKVNNQVEDVTLLKANSTYYYDLDGDGKNDKIFYKSQFTEDTHITILKLYVNDKLCLTKEESCLSYEIQICDLDISDNYLDLYEYGRMESDGIVSSSFLRYDGKDIVENTSFSSNQSLKNFNMFRYSLGTVAGDGTFTIVIDTPIFTEATGCYYCSFPYQIKDNIISQVEVKTYSFTTYSKEYQYKAQKSFTVYEKVGSKTVLFKVKKGSTITFDKLYVTKSGKAYVRVVNSKGKKGWINADQNDLFYERPFWG